MLGVICDRRATRVKVKLYKMDLCPAMMNSLEMVGPTKIQEVKLEVKELKMFFHFHLE